MSPLCSSSENKDRKMWFPVSPHLLLYLCRWVGLSVFCFSVSRKLGQFLKKRKKKLLCSRGEKKERKCFDILSQNALHSSPPRLLAAFDLNSQIAPALLKVWFSAKNPNQPLNSLKKRCPAPLRRPPPGCSQGAAGCQDLAGLLASPSAG